MNSMNQSSTAAPQQYAPCPKCGGTEATKVSYTWWGGALGPAIFHHVKCSRCGATYNGKTGKSNTSAIIIYTVVIIVVCLLLYILVQGGH
jgi:predicted nucleic-acid-binding Zn-ribbon protein